MSYEKAAEKAQKQAEKAQDKADRKTQKAEDYQLLAALESGGFEMGKLGKVACVGALDTTPAIVHTAVNVSNHGDKEFKFNPLKHDNAGRARDYLHGVAAQNELNTGTGESAADRLAAKTAMQPKERQI